MSDPFKLRVLSAITDALKSITPANGYVSDLSDFVPGDGVMTARVYRGRLWFGEESPLPMTSVLEGTAPGDELSEPPQQTPRSEYEWPLIVQGFVKDDPQHPTDPAYFLLRDVKRRLAIEVKRKTAEHDSDILGLGRGGCRVTALRIGTGSVRPADDISARAYFWLSVVPTIYDDPLAPDA